MINNDSNDTSDRLRINQGAYTDYRLKSALESRMLIFAFPSILNFLLIFADISIIQNEAARYIIVFVRVAYSVTLYILLFRIRRIHSFLTFCRLTTFFEIITAGIFLYVFSQYPSPDFMIQTLGAIIINLAIFLIPNTWKNMILVVAGMNISFLVCARIWIHDLNPMSFWAGAVYITISILLCAFFTWNTQKAQRFEFFARQELLRQSSTDHLTQATTRIKLEEEAARWLGFCRRQQIPLSLIFVDVDNLKQINDKYGHLAGDKVLLEIVVRIRSSLRESDIVARWGGDEFVLLLPDVDLKKGVDISEAIRQSLRWKPLADNITATCSFGVVAMTDKSTFETMICEADDLMYKSKRLGKTRIEHA